MRLKYEKTHIFVFAIFFAGIMIGSLFSNTLDSSINPRATEITQLVNGFIASTNANGLPRGYLFGRSFLTFSKQVALIWVCGFFPMTIPIIGLLVGAQGFSYGFTTSFFVMEYNLKGLLLCLGAYGVQGTLFVFIVFLLSIESVRFARKDREVSPKIYLVYLLVSMLGVVIIALYESYIAPVVIQAIVTTFF